MNKNTIKTAVYNCVNDYDETVVLEMIDERKHEYIDDDDVADFDGDFEMAYDERGRGAAESDVLHEIIRGCGTTLTTDEFCEVFDTIAEIWNISTL